MALIKTTNKNADIREHFEERAAIMEHCAGMDKLTAEKQAMLECTKLYDFSDVFEAVCKFYQHLMGRK